MSSNKFTPKFAPIRFDSSSAFLPKVLSRDDWVAIMPRLEAARRSVVAEFNDRLDNAGAGQGSGSSGTDLPERLLADYRRQRRASELGRILAAAKRLREAVDRVVVVGSEDDCSAARALFEACCHPYHNEQGRGDRGGRPRIYFAGGDLDNDALQGLLDMLPHERPAATLDERWGMIVIQSGPSCRPPGDALPITYRNAEDAEIAERTTASVVFRVLFAALVQSCGSDQQEAANSVVPIDQSAAPPEGGTPTFSAAGLFPGSVMGLDIVRLLEGAAAMNERFRTAPIGDNPPLDLAGVCALMEQKCGIARVRFVRWGRGLAAAANWCQHLSGGITNLKSEISNPLSEISNSRFEISDLTINLIVESARRDRISVAATTSDDDHLKRLARQTLPDLQTAAIKARKDAADAAGCPAVDVRLPALDESSLGQLFQMLTLSLRVLCALRG